MAKYVVMPKADYEAACNSIRAKTGKTDLIKSGSMSAEIDSITGGGGSSADVRYVTFTNPATGETFVKPVAIGDDCVDVVAKGLWATPTQESTAQYDYAFANSWSAEPGGAADADILKNITEDKTVYAVFTATLRKYTITWLDSDGVTELPGQKEWAYGTVPSYIPEKEGAAFSKWTPEPVAVTGDATYTAVWAQKMTVVNYQKISTAWLSSMGLYQKQITENPSGKAIDLTKTYTVNWNGTIYECPAKRVYVTYGALSAGYSLIGNPYIIKKVNKTEVTKWTTGSADGDAAENTGEPFMIMIYASQVNVHTETAVSNVYVSVETTP